MQKFRVVETLYVERESTIEAATISDAETAFVPEQANTTHSSRKVEIQPIDEQGSVSEPLLDLE